MDRSVPMLLIGLIFGGGLGFVVAAANGITLDGHDHGDHGAPHAGASAHAHGAPIALPAGSVTLNARLLPDNKAGWNLFVQTSGFDFAPEAAGQPHRSGQGHAHLYLNDVKIARLYGPAFHLETVVPGDRVRVELNSNDHHPLTSDKRPLAVELTVPAEPAPVSADGAGQP